MRDLDSEQEQQPTATRCERDKTQLIRRTNERLEAYRTFRELGCAYCGYWYDWEKVPFDRCRYCDDSPCFHHGRCCPARFDH